MRSDSFFIWAIWVLSVSAFPLWKRLKTPAVIAKRANTTFTIPSLSLSDLQSSYGKPYAFFRPKVVIVNTFDAETTPWTQFNFTQNITIPGLLPLYPSVHCVNDFSVCQLTTGEGEINAASSITALGLLPSFDLSKTYFLVAGIAGGEPTYTTLGSVTFARFAVQVGLEYQVAYQEAILSNPSWASQPNYLAGYFALGTNNPGQYPNEVYGTELFELNGKLRDKAFSLAQNVTLNNGTEGNVNFRLLYSEKAALSSPLVVKCDVVTSDAYFSGNVLSNYFGFYAGLISNGSAKYCATAQEDNAFLEAFTRLTRYGLVDYDRVVVMRSISDFSRPPPQYQKNAVGFLTENIQGGDTDAIKNLAVAGLPFVKDVLNKWESEYFLGSDIKPKNYTGDIINSLNKTLIDIGKQSFYLQLRSEKLKAAAKK